MIQLQVTLVNVLLDLRDLVAKQISTIVNRRLVNMESVWMAKIHLVVLVIQAIQAICANIKLMNANRIRVSMEDDARIWSTVINVCAMLELLEPIVKSTLMNVIVILAGIMPNVWMVSIGMLILHNCLFSLTFFPHFHAHSIEAFAP